MNGSNAKILLQHLNHHSTAGVGRPRRASFPALAKCCGTVFGKEGSERPTSAPVLSGCFRFESELLDVRQEFYGDVIPDGMGDRAANDIFRDVKLTPAKRFGFFPSPLPVVDEIFSNVYGLQGARVLEPSAGTGSIARKAVEKGAIVDCVEIQKDYADTLRAEGIYNKVSCQDFLNFSTNMPYDLILQNSPSTGAGTSTTSCTLGRCWRPAASWSPSCTLGSSFPKQRRRRRSGNSRRSLEKGGVACFKTCHRLHLQKQEHT